MDRTTKRQLLMFADDVDKVAKRIAALNSTQGLPRAIISDWRGRLNKVAKEMEERVS